MRKTLYLLTLTLVLSLSALFGFSGCNDVPVSIEPKLVGFDDVSIYADLDKDFSVGSYLTAIDDQGNNYTGVVTVKDFEGNYVELVYNKFMVETLKPYKVTITIEMPNGEIKTRVVTVEGKDASFPEYVFSFKLIAGTVDSEYVLPTATATKSVGEEMIAKIKVYSEKTGNEIPVVDGKFTPKEEGKYYILAETTDYYGDTYNKKLDFVIRPKMSSDLALEDFDNSNSIDNLNRREWFDNNTKSTWVAQKADDNDVTAEGVAYTLIYYNNRCVAGRFNKTEAELLDLIDRLETLNARVMVKPGVVGVETFALKYFGVRKTIEVNKWIDLSMTTDDLLAKMPGVDDAEKKANFAKAYNNRGSGKSSSGIYIFMTDNFYDATTFPVQDLPFYVDSLTCTKSEIGDSQIILGSYTAPTESGTTFTLPTAKIVDDKGDTLVGDYTLSVQNNGKELAVIDNSGVKSINVYSGTTLVKYEFVYNEKSYFKTFSFNVDGRAAMASDMLEDFNDSLSVNNLTFDAAIAGRNFATWMESKTDVADVVAKGVVTVKITSDQVAAGRFNKTEAELISIINSLDKLTVRIMATKDGKTTYNFKLFGIQTSGIEIGKWVDISITKAEILSKMKGETDEERIADFAKSYCNTGVGQSKSKVCIYWIPQGADTQLYVDSVSFTRAPIGDSQIVLDSYTAPTEAGTTFTLPASKIVDYDGNTLVDAYTVTAQNNDNDIAIAEDNGIKSINVYSGTTVITYTLIYENKEFKKTITLVIENRGEMAIGVLENYDDSSSAKNLSFDAVIGDEKLGTWLESKADVTDDVAYGVTTLEITADQIASGRFNKTEAELITMMDKLDSVTARIMVTKDGASTYKFKLFGAETTGLEMGRWVEVSATKAQILSKMAGTTNEEKIADFARAYSITGDGLSDNNLCVYWVPQGAGMQFYVDSISFVEAEIADSQIIIESYTAPTEAAVTFTLPTAKIVDANGDALVEEYTVTAKNNNTAIAITEGNGVKSIKIYSGTTSITYTLVYNNKEYVKSIGFTFENRGPMASNMLEDFNDSLSKVNLTKNTYINATVAQKEPATWLESKADVDGVIAYGVATVNIYKGNACAAGRFNKTQEELVSIMNTLDTFTIRLMVIKDGSTTYNFKLFGYTRKIEVGKWVEISVTKAEILSKQAGATDEEKIADFAKKYCSSGIGYANNLRIYGAPNLTVDMPMYVDQISFTSVNN